MDIGLAPRNGDLIVLRDALSGGWAIGRWAEASACWVDTDGQPLRLVPTHWEPVAGEAFAQSRRDNWFIVKALAPTVFAATRYPSFRILFSAAVMLVAIYATSGFRLTDRWPFQALAFNKVAAQPDPTVQHQIAELTRELAQARAETKLTSERADTAQAELRNATSAAEAKQAELVQQLNASTAAAQAELSETKRSAGARQAELAQQLSDNAAAAQSELREAKRVADAKLAELTQQLNNSTATTQIELRNAVRIAEAKQTELKQRLSNAAAQTEKLTQDMTAELEAARRRAEDAQQEARRAQQAAKASDTKAAASRQALDETTAKANALESEVTSLRTAVASAAAAKAADTVANLPAPAADQPAVSASVTPQPQDATAGLTTSALTAAPDRSAVATAPPQPAAPTEAPRSEPPPTTPARSISPAAETRLLARAQYLLQQLDFAGARLLLENGIDRGSTRAIALLAATYDEPTIHRLQAYGIKPDPERARALYTQAAAFGIEDARKRLEALSAGKP